MDSDSRGFAGKDAATVRSRGVRSRSWGCEPVTPGMYYPILGRVTVTMRSPNSNCFSRRVVFRILPAAPNSAAGQGPHRTTADAQRPCSDNFTKTSRKDGWRNKRRLDGRCAPNLPHQFGTPVCDSCHKAMTKLIARTIAGSSYSVSRNSI